MKKAQRALISVSDKSGIVEFAKSLSELGIAILSTGGTAKLFEKEGIPVTEVSAHTGFPEMLDGRVKTLHPKIHAGLLARRDSPAHMKALREAGIEPIDLVVVNLYPFQATIADPDCRFENAVENIDIGGPSMLRAAAKNHAGVAVLVDPADYARVLDELRASGAVGEATRLELGFATARRDAEHALRLLRERLGAVGLASPAEAIHLEAATLVPLAGASQGLFGDARTEAEEWERLTERLQARLGGAQVHGLATHAEHRPERAWRAVAAGEKAGPADLPPGPRPLWLLEPPRRLDEADFVLLAGPERIEAGWWDGEDVVRDYFVAARGATLAWIYRAHEGWYLHGLFA